MGRYAHFSTGFDYKFTFAVQSSEDITNWGGEAYISYEYSKIAEWIDDGGYDNWDDVDEEDEDEEEVKNSRMRDLDVLRDYVKKTYCGDGDDGDDEYHDFNEDDLKNLFGGIMSGGILFGNYAVACLIREADEEGNHTWKADELPSIKESFDKANAGRVDIPWDSFEKTVKGTEALWDWWWKTQAERVGKRDDTGAEFNNIMLGSLIIHQLGYEEVVGVGYEN